MKQLGGILVAALIGFVVVRAFTGGPDASPTSSDGVQYTLLDEKVLDAPVKTQVVQKVLAEGIPTEDALRAEILRRYKEVSSRHGFQFHSAPTNIYIYIFGTREQAATSYLWIGMIAKSYSETGTPVVVIDKSRLAALSATPQSKFGLSEEKRKELFREIVSAERRADQETSAQAANVKNLADVKEYAKVTSDLKEKYKAALAKQYGIDGDQMSKITVEGVTKGWPTPPFKP